MAYEFDGAARIDYRPEGVRCELTFPLTSAGSNLLQEAETSAERLRSDYREPNSASSRAPSWLASYGLTRTGSPRNGSGNSVDFS